ncbi:MAG TPA: type II toxin-antitoxin system VapB family antitoxin [Kiritimatiellia bacterium]|nr:type II toxin-antitoxin system VapB family antitoxin [Kiritimatiellia bacterium]HMP00835.1 type II toxin-antitoxin system VapB family antitoxin [Kiritimatiellia bacterium]
MRTTLDLPESLLNEAMKASHQKTKTAVIVSALNDLIRKNKLQQLRAFRGKVDINLDINQLRKRS